MVRSSTYISWNAAKQRCTNPKAVRFDRYGGRGITMCPEWAASFEAFLRDMGPRPSGTTLDRVNNDGNYEPSNCRWATRDEQENNKSTNRNLTLDGVTLTVTQWAARLGISSVTIATRLNRGWSVERALTGAVATKSQPVTINGVARSLKDWARVTGIPYSALFLRISHGWPPERAITEPLRIDSRHTGHYTPRAS